MEDGNHVFTEKSDVWSYGVTLWEIYTYGEMPYKELDNRYVKSAIKEGKKLQIREEFPESVQSVMELCWLEACKRPLFKDIVVHLRHVQKKEKENDNCWICQNPPANQSLSPAQTPSPAQTTTPDEIHPFILESSSTPNLIISPTQTTTPNEIHPFMLESSTTPNPMLKKEKLIPAVTGFLIFVTIIVIASVASTCKP